MEDLELLCREMLRYLKGEQVDFSWCKVDLSHLSDFEKDVLEQTRRIPYGHTITYGELAMLVGRRGASRAVGSALSKNPYPIIIPCHRVVSSKGIGGFCGGNDPGNVSLKRKLLELEGIKL
ncbi:methylated-DNA--[protein]-cysteine S-methyltransferase [Methanomethylovorans sp.]|uniref:methylated-DNA--[protein]-cysteine S-methyltransferase n=1 Tax=Methanomethylovorans sp. TaxID=2758717 RepID=UPI000A78CB2F|nr:MGMT family protein [Methanomethylovorans sp.]